MAKIRKLFGNMPERVHVLCEYAEFNEEGVADVSAEALTVFSGSPGYELVIETSEEEDAETSEEEDAEDEVEYNKAEEEANAGNTGEHIILKRVPRVKAIK